MIIDSNLPSCISPEHFKFCHREIKGNPASWESAGWRQAFIFLLDVETKSDRGWRWFPSKISHFPLQTTTTEYVATNCWCDVCQKHTTIRSIIPIGNVVSWLRQKIPSDVAVNFVDFLPFLTALLLFVKKIG